MSYDELTSTPFPCSLVLLWERRGEFQEQNLAHEKQRGGEKVFIQFVLFLITLLQYDGQ